MGTESWVEDESHRTINGERWVAMRCFGCSNGGPCCEFKSMVKSMGYRCERPKEIASCVMRGGTVRWYRADSPALAFFDNQKEKPKPATNPVRHLSEICMDGIRSSLKTLFQDRDRQAVEALRDSLSASLDARVQAAMDATMAVVDGVEMPAPVTAPEDDVEIIIDPMPEQVPGGWMWVAHWDEEDDLSEGNLFPRNAGSIKYGAWKHCAILVHGHLTPTELVARVRKTLAEKEGK